MIRQTRRVPLNGLWRANARPVDKAEYDRLGVGAMAHDRAARESMPRSLRG
ncbi:hypothetical protein KDW78_33010 [Burkholderia cenocepacia]|uniref:hypothetical protein n=1 Tax=Burkholderia cenocepacia TaxID=95486 RepID=UPI00158D8954|nr:hypothetical protein [Burkholderia cenocepacia]MBR7958716.1 hypothetical protein [Burkholderia cenocepacia]